MLLAPQRHHVLVGRCFADSEDAGVGTEAVVEEMKTTRLGKNRDLILGFDAGCFTCSDLGRRIEERVGDKLAVRNLNDPELLAWREQAFGRDAKWAPTLFEIGDGKVRAWTGWKMGATLTRKIGAAATWQVMQALGEVGVAPAEGIESMSRGQFLKGIGGAAMALSVLSGTGLLTIPTVANAQSPEVVSKRRITGNELQRVARQASLSEDVGLLAGNALNTAEKIEAATPVAMSYSLEDGNTLLVIAYVLANRRILRYSEYEKRPRKAPRTQARLFYIEDDQGERGIVVNGTEGGREWRRPRSDQQDRTSAAAYPSLECPYIGGNVQIVPGGSSQVGCNRCGGREGYYIDSVCRDYNFTCGCIVASGGACANVKNAKNPWQFAALAAVCVGGSAVCGEAVSDQGCCESSENVLVPCTVC